MEYSNFYNLTEKLSKKLYEPTNDIEELNQWKLEMIDLVEQISRLKLCTSTTDYQIHKNTSLDPTDWISTRTIAHQILDSSIESIQSIRNKPVWQPVPNEIRSTIENESLPKQGQSLSNIYHDISSYILPYTRGNRHPRFWGWAMGEGTFGGILADLLTSTMNINAGAATHSAVLVERTVIQWMRQIFGFPKDNHGGLLVSGTSMATVICLATARRRFLTNVRQNGIINGPHLIVYASKEVHVCVSKALELLGFGSNALHLISVNEQFSMNINELKQTIENDRKNGLIPFCIIGNAGTVNTGAFDNLLELSSIAKTKNLWFHVDGAFGSLIILDPERCHLVQGIDQADSLAFDFHKWLHCPYSIGCALIRNEMDLFSTFSVHQSYLANTERGCAGDKPWYCDLGIELSRPFLALKVWCILKEHGIEKFAEKIAENCQQAQYLVSLLEKHTDYIRIIRPVTLNIVNFRFEPKECEQSNPELIDTFNNELIADMQLSGIAVATTTRIYGRLYIRTCIISHRCTLEDFDIFVDKLLLLYHDRLQNLN